jgi:hypothetical protein
MPRTREDAAYVRCGHLANPDRTRHPPAKREVLLREQSPSGGRRKVSIESVTCVVWRHLCRIEGSLPSAMKRCGERSARLVMRHRNTLEQNW